MKPTDFARHLTAFLSDYLPAQRNVSPNTVCSYRDTFVLLLRFVRDQRHMAPEKLEITHIDPPLVLDFLTHLAQERQCSARTCNQRLGTLHAFFRYLQTEQPQHLEHCQRILAIPYQHYARAAVSYLSIEELKALLAQPDLTGCDGRRDAVLLSLLYDTGARCQELIDLSVRDVRLACPAQLCLTGKGRKTRVVPLMTNTVRILSAYMAEHSLTHPAQLDTPLFFNRHRARLSRSGVRYILEKYANSARRIQPSLPQRIGPHTLRHTKAMHLLQVGNPLTVIRDILGHVDIKSTEVYARADTEMKRRALEQCPEVTPALPEPAWRADKNLMQWLRSL